MHLKIKGTRLCLPVSSSRQDAWRSISTMSGGQFPVTASVTMKLTQHAGNLDSLVLRDMVTSEKLGMSNQ